MTVTAPEAAVAAHLHLQAVLHQRLLGRLILLLQTVEVYLTV